MEDWKKAAISPILLAGDQKTLLRAILMLLTVVAILVALLLVVS